MGCDGMRRQGRLVHPFLYMSSSVKSLIIFLVIGAVAGWLAGLLMRGGSFGLLGNIVVGVIGAVFGGWLFGVLGISLGGLVDGLVGSLITAVAGATVLLFMVGLIKKA